MSRKRPAPGASPLARTQQPLQQSLSFPTSQDTSGISNDQYLWDGANATNNLSTNYSEAPIFDTSLFNTSMNGNITTDNSQITADTGAYGGQLVRRNTNQQVAPRPRQANTAEWPEFIALTQQNGTWEAPTDDEELERRAMLAHKDAQAKRKQIPPFVQKLSSFLDDGKNTDLIRWSDDGNSFIVVDEDEFAKTLIPELFKHNNYASFVRQLNMYGFHKKVGLTDNSMRASEKKSKAPSEYYNKYFKRGRSELLWLIQKPKNPGGGIKRKKDDDKVKGSDSDDEGRRPMSEGPHMRTASVDEGGAPKNQELALIPISDFNLVRNELRTVQQQQKIIHNVISQLRQQNSQFYQQASAFQALHDRHENSINAILTFLATFYNRSLEGNSGANIADMFANVIPPNTAQNHGTVVDVEDYPEPDSNTQQRTAVRPVRRPLALLPAPDPKLASQSTTPKIAATRPTPVAPVRANSRSSIFKAPFNSAISQPSRKATVSADIYAKDPGSPTIKSDVGTPVENTSLPGNEDIMSVIQSVNNSHARSVSADSAHLDFPAALAHYQTADGKAPLTPEQRNQMLSLIANSAGAASPSGNLDNTNNALLNPTTPVLPSLEALSATDAQLDLLQQMNDEQTAKVQHLSDRFQPLNTSGTASNVSAQNGDGMGSFFGNFGTSDHGDVDLNSFINADDYFTTTGDSTHLGGTSTDPNNDLGLNDLDFSFTDSKDIPQGNLFGDDDAMLGTNDFGYSDNHHSGASYGHGRVESVSSGAPSPGNSVDDHMMGKSDMPGSPHKRQRRL